MSDDITVTFGDGTIDVAVEMGGEIGPVGDPGGNVMSAGLFTALGSVTINAGTNLIQTTGYDAVGTGAALYVDDALSNSALATAHPRLCKVDDDGRYFRALPDSDGFVRLSLARASGDTTDEPASAAARAYVLELGLRGVRFDGAGTELKPPLVADEFADWSGYGSQPVNVRPGTRVDARGTVIDGDPAGGFGEKSTVYARLNLLARYEVDAAFTAGAVTVPIATTTGLAAGDWVLGRFGDIPTDTPETTNWHFAKVASVSAGVSVTLKDPVTKAFSSGDLAAATLNKYVWKITPLTDELDTDFVFASGTEVGLDVKGMVGGRIRSITGPCPDACALILQFCSNVTVGYVNVRDNIATGGNQGSAGRCAETTAHVQDWHCSNIIGQTWGAEAGSRIHFDRISDHNSEGTRTLLVANGSSHITFDEMKITGLGGQTIGNAVDGPLSTIRGRRLIVQTSTAPVMLSNARLGYEITDELVYEVGGLRETYNMRNGWWSEPVTFDLVNGASTYEPIGPKGTLVAHVLVIATNGATAGVTANIGRYSFTANYDFSAEVVAGKAKLLYSGHVQTSGVNGPDRTTDGLFFNVTVAASGGGVPVYTGNEQVTLRAFIVPNSDLWEDLGATGGQGVAITDAIAKGMAGHRTRVSGTTANRPTNPSFGTFYLDTTLDADGKPIWFTPASVWVDATGAVV